MITTADIARILMQDSIHTVQLCRWGVRLETLPELMQPGVPTVRPSETLDSVLDKFSRCDVHSLPVTKKENDNLIDALITRQSVMTHYYAELDQQVS